MILHFILTDNVSHTYTIIGVPIIDDQLLRIPIENHQMPILHMATFSVKATFVLVFSLHGR